MSRISFMKVVLCFLLIIVNGCIPALSSESLAESDHPYANNFEKTWTIEGEPSASQIRLHFEYLQLASDDAATIGGYDKVILLDKFDNKLGEYGDYYGTNYQGFWTEWYTGDTLKVKLVTDSSRTDYGFKIDKIETRPDTSINSETLDKSNSSDKFESLPKSDSPYANNFVDIWNVSEPGASKLRLHFEYIQLAYDDDLMFEGYDKVILLDRNGRELKTYGDYDGVNYQNFWTDWYAGDTLKIKLVTDGSRTDYGFKIDKIETSNEESSKIQSNGADSSDTERGNTLTATELTSSPNPSTLGQSVTLTAIIDTSSDETEEPFGTVTFMDGTTRIGVGDLISGQATLTTSSLSAGSHSIKAKYRGDINFKSSISSPFTLLVQEQPSTEEPSSTEEQPSSNGQNSLSRNIITILSQNPLISTIVGGIVVFLIQQKLTPPKGKQGHS